MVLEIIAAALLIALGVFAIFFAIEGGTSDQKLLIILVLGVIAVFGGGWLLISRLTLFLILKKVGGLLLSALGFFFVVGFPDIKDYQAFEMSFTGIFFGLIMLVVGVWLLLF